MPFFPRASSFYINNKLVNSHNERMVFASLIIVENIILSVYYVYMYKGAIECRCSDTCVNRKLFHWNRWLLKWSLIKKYTKGWFKVPMIYFLEGNVAWCYHLTFPYSKFILQSIIDCKYYSSIAFIVFVINRNQFPIGCLEYLSLVTGCKKNTTFYCSFFNITARCAWKKKIE